MIIIAIYTGAARTTLWLEKSGILVACGLQWADSHCHGASESGTRLRSRRIAKARAKLGWRPVSQARIFGTGSARLCRDRHVAVRGDRITLNPADYRSGAAGRPPGSQSRTRCFAYFGAVRSAPLPARGGEGKAWSVRWPVERPNGAQRRSSGRARPGATPGLIDRASGAITAEATDRGIILLPTTAQGPHTGTAFLFIDVFSVACKLHPTGLLLLRPFAPPPPTWPLVAWGGHPAGAAFFPSYLHAEVILRKVLS